MISIIVPVYNVENYLEECLFSIQRQTLTEWECILVDDGSKDSSPTICDEWEKKDHRFHTIHQKNQGAAIARNTGIQYAKGEYIAFIDSDDWIDADYLESLYDSIDNSDHAISGMIMEYTNCTPVIHEPRKSRIEFLDSSSTDISDLIEEGLFYSPCLKLYKSSVIKDFGVAYPTDKIFGEDLQFNFKFLEHVKSIKCVAAHKYHYRIIGQNTLSTIFREDQYVNDYEQWLIQYNFYKERHLLSKRASDFLYRRLWGQVYDGLFLYGKIKTANMSYIKTVLSTPHIDNLKNHQDLFSCAKWIKWAILHRATILFFIYFEIQKRLCK